MAENTNNCTTNNRPSAKKAEIKSKLYTNLLDNLNLNNINNNEQYLFIRNRLLRKIELNANIIVDLIYTSRYSNK